MEVEGEKERDVDGDFKKKPTTNNHHDHSINSSSKKITGIKPLKYTKETKE